jgi:hypothetical protein
MGESGSLVAIVAVRPAAGLAGAEVDVDAGGAEAIVELLAEGGEAIVDDEPDADEPDAESLADEPGDAEPGDAESVAEDAVEDAIEGEAVSLATPEPAVVLGERAVEPAALIKSLRTQPDPPDASSTLYQVKPSVPWLLDETVIVSPE